MGIDTRSPRLTAIVDPKPRRAPSGSSEFATRIAGDFGPESVWCRSTSIAQSILGVHLQENRIKYPAQSPTQIRSDSMGCTPAIERILAQFGHSLLLQTRPDNMSMTTELESLGRYDYGEQPPV
jgi:hypothetical protein